MINPQYPTYFHFYHFVALDHSLVLFSVVKLTVIESHTIHQNWGGPEF